MFNTEKIVEEVSNNNYFVSSNSYYKPGMFIWHTVISKEGKPIKNPKKRGESPIWKIVKVEQIENEEKWKIWVEEVTKNTQMK